MARGKRCPACGSPMYGQDEKYQGTWVTYVCRNGTCPSVKRGHPEQAKEFESN